MLRASRVAVRVLAAYFFFLAFHHRTALNVSDEERTKAALKGIGGERLTYRRSGEATHA